MSGLSSELNRNAFSVVYLPCVPVKTEDLEDLPSAERRLKRYEHSDACAFAAESRNWVGKTPPTTAFPREFNSDSTLPTFAAEYGIRAIYRVIRQTADTYILIACHQNVHALHRADLRFVEVNDRTETRGWRESVVGRLFLGDIVAITELAPLNSDKKPLPLSDIKNVSPEDPCFWMARKMTILERHIVKNVQFTVMSEGVAVVNGYGEGFRVESSLQKDKVYVGDVFIPAKMSTNFTDDHDVGRAHFLLSSAAGIPTFPEPSGSVVQFTTSDWHTQMFEIGTNAFKRHTGSTAAEIVEFCALIGYSAAKTMLSSHDDSRKFLMINPVRTDLLVRFKIANPTSHPTDELWSGNDRLKIVGANNSVNAIIETVICEGSHLKIAARLSRDVPTSLDFSGGSYTVQQRSPMEGSVIEKGFFSNMQDSNGKRIIETLYGGRPIESFEFVEKKQYLFPSTPPIVLNQFQSEYVSRVLMKKPIVVANAPFGCGKSMTIVTAAIYWHRIAPKTSVQYLITQSNFASVNLVDIVLKTRPKVSDVRFLRYVSDSNWKEIINESRTQLDMPALMDVVFKKWATTENHGFTAQLSEEEMILIVHYVSFTLNVRTSSLNRKAQSLLKMGQKPRKVWPSKMTCVFFKLYQPEVIIITASSLPGLLSRVKLPPASLVQLDEASQLPEYTLLSLLKTLPDAYFGLTGDIKQLAPYCEDQLTGKLKDYGVGNAMEPAVTEKMFPQVALKSVYRCHPAMTKLLSELFYDNELISEVKEHERSEFISANARFWPNAKFPIMIVDNKEKAVAMGTSFANATEQKIATQIVEFITRNEGGVHEKDVGVISFYGAQRSMLTELLRGTAVKCGTVDSFQGCEKEVVILCCTNDDVHEFMQVKNRLNVAMSRSKQVTILIGNVKMLKTLDCWSTIVERAEQNGCVVNTNKYPFKVNTTGQATNKKVSKISKRMSKLTIADSNRGH